MTFVLVKELSSLENREKAAAPEGREPRDDA